MASIARRIRSENVGTRPRSSQFIFRRVVATGMTRPFRVSTNRFYTSRLAFESVEDRLTPAFLVPQVFAAEQHRFALPHFVPTHIATESHRADFGNRDDRVFVVIVRPVADRTDKKLRRTWPRLLRNVRCQPWPLDYSRPLRAGLPSTKPLPMPH